MHLNTFSNTIKYAQFTHPKAPFLVDAIVRNSMTEPSFICGCNYSNGNSFSHIFVHLRWPFYPTNNRLSGLHNQSPQRNEMSKCYIRSTYMVGGWWVVDTIPFQNIYFSTITLGDDLLVLFPMPLIQNSQLAGLFSEWRLNLSQTHNLWSICIYFNYPRASFQEIDWARGRRDEKKRRAAQWWWSANQVACLIYRHPCT